MQTKRCNHCLLEKSIAEFCKNKTSLDGLNPYCKFCSKVCSSKWYRSRPKEVRTTTSYIKHLQPKSRFRRYKINATKRHLLFDLTEQQFSEITAHRCSYCNDYNRLSHPSKKIAQHCGIDRKDNSKGYTIENCIPCCTICNRMKEKMSIKDFVDQCKRIVSNFEVVNG